MAAAKTKEAPFKISDGSLFDYPPYSYGGRSWEELNCEWREITEFDLELQLEDIERGRSAARFIWVDPATGAKYPMFMTDMKNLVLSVTMERGLVMGTWTVVKRGANYGIKLVK